MIFVVTPDGESWEFNDYLNSLGKELIGCVRMLTCDEILAAGKLSLGSYVFMAIDQMTPTEREITSQCWEKLRRARSDLTLINRPSEVSLRYNLLRLSYKGQRNIYRVYRASEFLLCRNFPVFVRGNLDHNGSLTPLLHTQQELILALTKAVYRGHRLRDLIIVEYCHTADASGIFRKYSAFIVGEKILPHTLMHSNRWVTKSEGRLIDAATAAEEIDYVRNNPHAEWLRETFALAKIRYGRIDYGLRNGEPQLWEINTNPTIIRVSGARTISEEQHRLREPVRQQFFPSFLAALKALDSTVNPNETISIDVSPADRRKLEAEKQIRLRVKARKTTLSQAAGFLVRSFRRALQSR
jgi:hypothetical protein